MAAAVAAAAVVAKNARLFVVTSLTLRNLGSGLRTPHRQLAFELGAVVRMPEL
jgi:uncharacterized membrane protein YhhN